MTEHNGHQQDSAPEVPQRGHRMGRRGVLRLMGLGVLGIAPLPILSSLIKATLAGHLVRSDGEVARTTDGRIRQWAMVIDLRY